MRGFDVPSLGPVEVEPASEKDMLSGAGSDAILYFGPPENLTESPIGPDIYLDPDYFNEENRRSGGVLDWDKLLQENSVVPKGDMSLRQELTSKRKRGPPVCITGNEPKTAYQ